MFMFMFMFLRRCFGVRTGKTLSFLISRPQFTKCGETWLGYTAGWATPPLAATMATPKKACPDQTKRGSEPRRRSPNPEEMACEAVANCVELAACIG
jgi:hypothetical protein